MNFTEAIEHAINHYFLASIEYVDKHVIHVTDADLELLFYITDIKRYDGGCALLGVSIITQGKLFNQSEMICPLEIQCWGLEPKETEQELINQIHSNWAIIGCPRYKYQTEKQRIIMGFTNLIKNHLLKLLTKS